MKYKQTLTLLEGKAPKYLFIGTSVTRWPDYFSTFSHLHQRKFAQWHTNLVKVGPKFC